ncbi:MAG: septum formation initiator family protein [Eubacterium sp.]|jgi:cell division protein DivIC|nr:septum formation initiator family protein [Eubacterium sp.]
MRRNRKKNKQAGRASIAYIVIFLLLVMSVQIFRVYQKDMEYIAREAELRAQLEEEKNREKKISDYKEYMGSKEYIEDTAKSKLGLVYENEIIFKER